MAKPELRLLLVCLTPFVKRLMNLDLFILFYFGTRNEKKRAWCFLTFPFF